MKLFYFQKFFDFQKKQIILSLIKAKYNLEKVFFQRILFENLLK